MLIKGDPNDKEYQKKLIDHLVYKVFVYDDTVITYLTFGNDKEIKEIDLADNDKVLSAIKVQSLSSLVHQDRQSSNSLRQTNNSLAGNGKAILCSLYSEHEAKRRRITYHFVSGGSSCRISRNCLFILFIFALIEKYIEHHMATYTRTNPPTYPNAPYTMCGIQFMT